MKYLMKMFIFILAANVLAHENVFIPNQNFDIPNKAIPIKERRINWVS